VAAKASITPKAGRRLTSGEHHYRNEKTTMNANTECLQRIGYREVGRFLIGVILAGISFVNRQPDQQGIYWRLAFLPFDTLTLEVSPGCPVALLAEIEADAATNIAGYGEYFELLTSGQYVDLGS